MKLLLIYLLLINATGFLLMIADKHKAKKNLWRIPEKTLFLVAALGGSLGCLGGMYAARHKTQHLAFTLGMPIILAVQIVIAVVIATHTVG